MLVTTSRKASVRTRNFASDLAKSFPNAVYSVRGKKSIEGFVDDARYNGKRYILVVSDAGGNPVEIKVISIAENGWVYAFAIKIRLIRLRKELGKAKEKVDGISIDAGAKIKGMLKRLNIEADAESEYSLVEKSSVISIYRGKAEIGPKFRVLTVENYGKQ